MRIKIIPAVVAGIVTGWYRREAGARPGGAAEHVAAPYVIAIQGAWLGRGTSGS